MAATWQIVLDRQPFDFYRSLRSVDRRALDRAFAELEANPFRQGDLQRRDLIGRTIEIGVFGKFLLHSWDDYPAKELRIVRIERMN